MPFWPITGEEGISYTIKLRNDATFVLEVKGFEDEQARAKHEVL